MLSNLAQIAMGVMLAFLLLYVCKRIIGAVFMVVVFLLKTGVYAIPVIFTIFFGLINPWLLIPCCLLSTGYYFLVFKIKRMFKARKEAMEY